MEKQIINPNELHNHPAYSRIFSVSNPKNFHFIAGMTPADENYNCIAPGNLLEQYYKVMEDLQLCLTKVKASWSDVVFRRIYVRNMDDFIQIQTSKNTREYFKKGEYPPSTLIEVTRLSNPEFLIEIDLLAIT
ncbi:Rid family hydrolase [Leptospira sp. GIMC2001]|uniref:Rid family hydrolase n=1 Tax=Leptospira sp. GIMC2001 TaxID=1513297 RepID=UPI00234A55BA|nr:Rid family hydrolase [Leptospira sp. GIMC2001]WCL48463.1 Rid family hydrolase [Leptospira sp. GIMC2001]